MWVGWFHIRPVHLGKGENVIMCEFKSGIILKNRVILAPEGNESHSDLLEGLGIEDTHLNATKTFVRVELIPQEGDCSKDINKWNYRVDQDFLPEWYEKDTGKYEEEFRNVVKNYIEERTVRICNKLWTYVKKGNLTYYFLYGVLFKTNFGKNNNYAESDVLTKLQNHKLVEELKNEFGDRLVPITTDLTSMDGLKDYGVVEGNTLSLLTSMDLIEFGEHIPPIGTPYWLASPNQTRSRGDSSCVRYVGSGGGVYYDDCDWSDGGVRPFCIIKS